MTGDISYEALELLEGAEFEGLLRRTGASSPKPATSAGAETVDGAAVETGALAGAA